jgi:hypothetical protein
MIYQIGHLREALSTVQSGALDTHREMIHIQVILPLPLHCSQWLAIIVYPDSRSGETVGAAPEAVRHLPDIVRELMLSDPVYQPDEFQIRSFLMELLHYIFGVAAESSFALKGAYAYQIAIYRKYTAEIKRCAAYRSFYFSISYILAFRHVLHSFIVSGEPKWFRQFVTLGSNESKPYVLSLILI